MSVTLETDQSNIDSSYIAMNEEGKLGDHGVSNWSKVKEWVIVHKKELLIALLVVSLASLLTGLGLIIIPAILFTAIEISSLLWSGIALYFAAAFPFGFSVTYLIYQRDTIKELS